MAEACLYVYPWDVAELGPDAMVKWAVEHGVDRLAVAVAYHSAELIAPDSTGHVHRSVEANVSYLPLPDANFTTLSLPPGRLALSNPDLFPKLRECAYRAGIGLTAWTVALHNSDLASRSPDAALENGFGDRSAHGLCPAHPDVRTYALELVTGVAGTRLFDEVMVESLSYLIAPHGHPHELVGVRMDTATRVLLSLCFCKHCLRFGEEAGIDGMRLRAWVCETLRRVWNGPAAGVRSADDGLDLLGLVFARPDLGDWIRMRSGVVSSLLAQVSRRAQESGARLAAGGPVWARPLPLGIMEGIDIASGGDVASRTVLMPYYRELDPFARDLEFAISVGDPRRFQVLQTLWHTHHPGGLSDLTRKIDLALSLGFDQFGFYNFATATAPALEWVRAVTEHIHSRS
jgi:hypothetical protein